MNAHTQYFKDSVLTGRPSIESLKMRLPNLVGAMRKVKADAYHTDDDYATFLSRELEATAVKVLETPLSGLPLSEGAIIPINSSIPEGADSFTYVVESGTGQAQWEDDYASGSLPMVEQNAKEFLKPIREFGIAWQISLHEMRASSFAGRGDLGQKKARTAMRGMSEFQEFVGMYGDASRDMQGFANHPNVPIVAPTYDSVAGSSDWDKKSGDLIQADIVAMKQLMLDTTNGALEISRMQIPARIWASLDRPYQVQGATNIAINGKSIRQFIVEANPEIDFGSMLRLQENKSQAPPLTPEDPTQKQLSADRVVAYANSPDVVELVRPIPPRFQPGQWYELRMKHPGYSTTGGVVFWQPNGAVYMDVKEAA
jgi:hypothetical protein